MIELTNKYWLDSDEYNWIVGIRYKDNRNNNYYLRDQRFFSRIDSALSWVMDQSLKDCGSIPEIFDRIEKLRKSLNEKTNFLGS